MNIGRSVSVAFPRALLFQTAKNLAIDHLRKAKFEPQGWETPDLVLDKPSGVPSAEQVLLDKQRIQILFQAIDSLPPRCREAFLLHRVHECSYREIARRLSISESAVEKLIMRALVHCRGMLQRHAAAYEEVVALWSDPALRSAASRAAGLSMSFRSHRPDGRRSPFRFQRIAIAATIAGLVVMTGLSSDLSVRFLSDHSTSTAEQRIVQLSDRSSVTLNAQSAIDEAFDASARRVHLLRGEAFFQVVHDQHKPFVVDSSAIAVRAVGTAFVVRQESDGIRVTVTEGTVELMPLQPTWPFMRLTAGQQVFVTTDRAGPIRVVDLKHATAWLRGRFLVEDAPLSDVIEELRRYHTGTIQVWNRSANEIRVSGSYNLADPMAVLLALTETLPVRMVRFTDHIVVLF